MVYPVMLEDEKIGVVQVKKKGLYLEIICECSGLRKDFYRLEMKLSDRSISLGLLICEGSLFVTRKRIPRKLIGEEIPRFSVYPIRNSKDLVAIPLTKGKPITNLKQLRETKLLFKNGKLYLSF